MISKMKVAIVIFMLTPLTIAPVSPQLGGFTYILNDSADSIDIEYSQNPKSEFQNNPLTNNPSPSSEIIPAASEASGILDSRTVEQVGYYDTGSFEARTDTHLNCINNLPIDVENDWQASSAEIDIWNLNRLYTTNYTLDDGYPGINTNPSNNATHYPLGWNSTSTTTDPTTTQISAYVDTDRSYVVVENQGKTLGTGINERTQHALGTEILWTQVIDNAPYTEDFIFSTDFLYKIGPIDPALGSSITLIARLNGIEIWSTSLAMLSAHEIWYNSGNITVNLPGASSSMLFEIGLKINVTLSLYHDVYDILDAHYFTAYLDDISLTGVTPPDFNNIDFQLYVGGLSTPISGTSGIGSASIFNPLFWNDPIVPLLLTTNVSVSFEYEVRLENHRFLNSSWTNDINQHGVHYRITTANTSELIMFTYLAFIGLYDELTLRIYHPIDWDNFKILDPFLNDVTTNCNIETDYIEIPTILLDILGWWQIQCQSPNYGYDAFIEQYDSDLSHWVNGTIFHSYDTTRLSVALQYGSTIPILTTPVHFTWALANSSTWYESSTTSGLVGTAASSSVTFGPTNTTAGYWGVIYHWTNGSELAFGRIGFELHHQAEIEPIFLGDLETYVGLTVTIVIQFHDVENDLIILNDGTQINGTWTGGVVQFEPNVVKNWWEGSFNTALVGAGNFDVEIVSASSYFETEPLIVTIKSQYLTTLNAPNGPLEPLIYGRSYSFDFIYTANYDGSGIENAVVEIDEDGSDWVSVTELDNGHYNLTLTPLGLLDYSIRITFSKVGYENQTHYLNFLVQRVPIKVTFQTDLSGTEQRPLVVKVEITEVDTNRPVIDANVTLSVLSRVGVLYSSETMIEDSNGVYTATITMPIAGAMTYSAFIYVEKENYEMTQVFSKTLVPSINPNARLVQYLTDYSIPILFSIGIFIGAIVAQKQYSRKRTRKLILVRSIKSRFYDANNLLGIIVLHKLSGIPIYSKILKGGLEEGMLSAFITAIMHFRSEFDMASSTDEYKVLPISDIVRAVPTQNLVCAFITITSASPEQEKRMISFTRAIGMMLDETLSQRPTKVADVKTVKTLEWLFDDFVDGGLIRDYQIGEKSLPKQFNCIREVVMKDGEPQPFKPMNMVRLLQSYGIYEDDAYILVMNAIENEYIIPIISYELNSDGIEIDD